LAFGRAEFLEGDSEPTAGADRSSPSWNKRSLPPSLPSRLAHSGCGFRLGSAACIPKELRSRRSRIACARIYANSRCQAPSVREFALPSNKGTRIRVAKRQAYGNSREFQASGKHERVRFIGIGALAHSTPAALNLPRASRFSYGLSYPKPRVKPRDLERIRPNPLVCVSRTRVGA